MKTIHGTLTKENGIIYTDYFSWTVGNKDVLLNDRLFEKDYNNKRYSVFTEVEVGHDLVAFVIIDKAVRDKFAQLVFKEHGVEDNPKAQKAWDLAKRYSHSINLSEIKSCFEDLVELII